MRTIVSTSCWVNQENCQIWTIIDKVGEFSVFFLSTSSWLDSFLVLLNNSLILAWRKNCVEYVCHWTIDNARLCLCLKLQISESFLSIFWRVLFSWISLSFKNHSKKKCSIRIRSRSLCGEFWVHSLMNLFEFCWKPNGEFRFAR